MSETNGIDPRALDRLDQLGGPGFANRIIGIFLTDVPRRVEEARQALAARDREAMAYAVHAIISSAGNVGASRLAALTRTMEQDAEAERWEALRESMERLAGTVAEVGAGLERERDRRR